MLSPEARADVIAVHLSSAGFSPRVTYQADHTCIETEVPESVSANSWRELLKLLETADWFGLDSSESGLTAWAGFSKGTPATIAFVRGHGHQL